MMNSALTHVADPYKPERNLIQLSRKCDDNNDSDSDGMYSNTKGAPVRTIGGNDGVHSVQMPTRGGNVSKTGDLGERKKEERQETRILYGRCTECGDETRGKIDPQNELFYCIVCSDMY
eukprot:1109107_1